MGDFDTLMSCRIGGNPLAGFTVTQYQYKSQPVTAAGVGITGVNASLDVEGYITGDTVTELASRAGAIEAACQRGRQDITVLGPGGVIEAALLAARAAAGGPYADVQIGTAGGGVLRRAVKLSARCQATAATSWTVPPAQYVQTTAETPSGAPTVTRRGSVGPRADGETPGGTPVVGLTAYLVFQDFILPDFRRAYPPPRWVVDHSYEEDADGRSAVYTLRASQLAAELPGASATLGADGQPVSGPIDGTYTVGTDTDDSGRKTKTVAYDFLYRGDPAEIHAYIRRSIFPQPETAERIVREAMATSQGKELRMRGGFTLVGSAESDGIIEFVQGVEAENEDNHIAAKSYPGVGVILYQETPRARTATQSGRAVGIGFYPEPPLPVFDAKWASMPRRIKREQLGGGLFAVSWTYGFLFPAAPLVGPEVLAKLAIRPKRAMPGGGGA